MQRNWSVVIIIFLLTGITACNSVSEKEWNAAIPHDSPFVFVPEKGTLLQEIPELPETPFIDDITPGSIQLISVLAEDNTTPVWVNAFLLYPNTSTTLQPVWICQTQPGYLEKLSRRYLKPFTDNNYVFHDIVIHKLHLQDNNMIYGAQIGSRLILSPSSYGVEQSVQSYLDQVPPLKPGQKPAPGTFISNTPHLDTWLEQLGRAIYRPVIHESLNGLEPALTSVSTVGDTSRSGLRFNSVIPFSGTAKSTLVQSISSINAPVFLDRYIPANAAGFALLRLNPPSIPPTLDDANTSSLDSLLQNDRQLFQNLSGLIEPSFAFVGFAESGISNTSEYMYLRKIKDPEQFQAYLSEFLSSELIIQSGNSYLVQSRIMGILLGSELSDLKDFYLTLSGDVAAISKRKGLAESVEADRTRRRVIFYDDVYAEKRLQLPGEVSGFIWISSREFRKFIAPYLTPQNYSSAILSRFDLASLTFISENDSLRTELNTFRQKSDDAPYEELWIFPFSDTDLSGTPVLADIAGSSREEVIFATKNGTVYGLASDGTQVFQVSTEGEEPLGSPILYDWYGNGLEVVLLAAGNKLYGWNRAGTLLPKFPFELPARISAPVELADVQRNGVPEVIIPTEDRSVHILDGRGLNIEGWPQRTNTVITKQPQFQQVDNIWSVWAAAENGLHSWLQDGTLRSGFPQFGNAPFTTTPLFHNNSILSASADGFIYSFGNTPLFTDTLASVIPHDSLSIQSLYVADSEIHKLTFFPDVLLNDTTGFYREDVFLSYSTNGSIFMNNTSGKLEFTQSMGQPASRAFDPVITDINSDNEKEVLALAAFGRLYVWEVLTGERLFDLPTSGMQYPLITDLNGDGLMELIAQTREGVRCWTIRQRN